jgi:hypothetical protein
MIPHNRAHERISRWMRVTDPVWAARVEGCQLAGTEFEIVEQGDLRMLYAHVEDRSCCQEITNRNQPGIYIRNAQGGLIRGWE